MTEQEKNDIINIEAYAKQGKKPKFGRAYIIKVDGQYYQVKKSTITGKKILVLARRPSDEYYLQEKLKDGTRRRINPDQSVDLVEDPCPERFETIRIQIQACMESIKSDILDEALEKVDSEKNIDQQEGLFMLRDIVYKTNAEYKEDTKNHIHELQDYTSIIMNLMIKILNSFNINSPNEVKEAEHDNVSMSKSIPIFLTEDAFKIKQLIIDLFFKPSIETYIHHASV